MDHPGMRQDLLRFPRAGLAVSEVAHRALSARHGPAGPLGPFWMAAAETNPGAPLVSCKACLPTTPQALWLRALAWPFGGCHQADH